MTAAERLLSEVTPIRLVVAILGLQLQLSTLGIIVLPLLGVDIPNVLGTIAVASMTGLTGLLTPNTGLRGSASERQAAIAGQAAAAAVAEHHGLSRLAQEADELGPHRKRRHDTDGA